MTLPTAQNGLIVSEITRLRSARTLARRARSAREACPRRPREALVLVDTAQPPNRPDRQLRRCATGVGGADHRDRNRRGTMCAFKETTDRCGWGARAAAEGRSGRRGPAGDGWPRPTPGEPFPSATERCVRAVRTTLSRPTRRTPVTVRNGWFGCVCLSVSIKLPYSSGVVQALSLEPRHSTGAGRIR